MANEIRSKGNLVYLDDSPTRRRINSMEYISAKKVNVGVQTIIVPKNYVNPVSASTFSLNILDFTKLWYSSHSFLYLVIFLTISLIGGYFFIPSLSMNPKYRNERLGITAASITIIGFSLAHYPDSLMNRPHPIFWRFIMGCCTVYMAFVTYILFLDLDSARAFFNIFDNSLGVPLPEKSYAADCRLYTPDKNFIFQNVKETAFDCFVFAHFLGWWFKTLIFRDVKISIFLSVSFEILELCLKHWLPNFNECWWDSLILDVLACNLLGIYFGHLTMKYFSMKNYSWLNERKGQSCISFVRFINLIKPYEWIRYKWVMFESVRNYLGVCFVIVLNNVLDLNYFFVKYLLWIPPPHLICYCRIYLLGCLSFLGIREVYEFNTLKYYSRLGPGIWLLSIIAAAELAISIKFGKTVFIAPTPLYAKLVMYGSIVVFFALLIYMIIKDSKKKKKNKEEDFNPYNPQVDIDYCN